MFVGIPPHDAAAGRRAALLGLVGAATTLGETANAFDNAVKKVGGVKTPGPEPGNLGILPRGDVMKEATQGGGDGLKQCGVAPNCFSTTYNPMFDVGIRGVDPWRFTGKTPAEAMREVTEVMRAYPPGQQGIDGGGFEIKTSEERYLYVQFESMKKGYIDDLEFAISPDTPNDAKEGKLLLRSASRMGYYDLGTNAVRLNKIASDLSKKGGWEAPLITGKTHPGYWKDANCKSATVQEKFKSECL